MVSLASSFCVSKFESDSSSFVSRIYDPRLPLEPDYPATKPLADIVIEDFHTNPLEEEVILEVGAEEKERIQLRHAPPSPCYEGLTNNVSTPLMEIKNQQWKIGTPDFVKHDILGAYIQEIPFRGSLQDSIRLNTRVSKVWKNGKVWLVESIELKELSDGRLMKLRIVDVCDFIHPFPVLNLTKYRNSAPSWWQTVIITCQMFLIYQD